jgi:DNA-binding NtrC family response regulator
MAAKATILIVDKEKILVDLLTRTLSTNELSTFGTTSTDDASHLYSLHRPALVVVDPTIPNGFVFVDQVLKGNQSKLLVVSSGEDVTSRARSIGVEHIVSKEQGLDALATAIRRLIGTDVGLADRADAIHVLVVDDEDEIRHVLGEFLSDRGYAVKTASNGRDAINVLDDDPKIQILLLDVSMPVMGGMEALALIMAREKRPSVIMMTAVADREVARQALNLGAFDYILKPFNFSAIETSIVACLSHSEYHKQPWWKKLTRR